MAYGPGLACGRQNAATLPSHDGEKLTMEQRSHLAGVLALAVIALAAGPVLQFAGWPHAVPLELSGLMLAAIVSAMISLTGQPGASRLEAPLTLNFVPTLAALLLLGPVAALLVAAVGVVTTCFDDPNLRRHPRGVVIEAATLMIALLAAGKAHALVGGTTGHFSWPWQGVPIASAVLAYCFTTSCSAEIADCIATKRRIEWSWPKKALRDYPQHLIDAGIAVGLVEIIGRRAWSLLPIAAAPLYFAYRASIAHAGYRAGEDQRREALAALDEPLCAVDTAGLVTLWNSALERLVGCSRDGAMGRPLSAALPALGHTDLARAVRDVLVTQAPRALRRLGLAHVEGGRFVHVTVVPTSNGATLLWSDVTGDAVAERSLKRSEERFALTAAGANDGVWEWDLRTGQMYFSGRWRALVGLPAQAGSAPPEEWLDRVHPDDAAGLKEAIDAHLAGQTDHLHHEHRIRHEDRTYRRVLCRGVAVRGAERRASRMAGSLTDTTEYAMAQERLRTAAFRDPLTGLANRAVFVDRLRRKLDDRKWQGGSRFAVLYLDLDRFKVVNDSLGHLVGDQLLTIVSRRLESCLRDGDTLARLGGDEFALLLNGLSGEEQANAIAIRIQAELSAPYSIADRGVFTSASIGIAFSKDAYNHPEEMMRDADAAMYHAKARGKARHELFDAEMHALALDRLGLESDLRAAVKIEDFEVHYQPIVRIMSGRCAGFEALIRWRRNGVAVSPAKFIPIAEELGLIEVMGEWVLNEACQRFSDWQRRFPDRGLEYITVNVSTRQLVQDGFVGIVERTVKSTGIDPQDLRLEITETTLMDNPFEAASVLTELRKFGVKIYLDDFGTGYSSLNHLHKLPVDALKIDQSFVRSLAVPDRPAIVESIMALARTLNTSVVAEGVENHQQANELKRLGCEHAQGYLFSRPLSATAAEELLIANEPLGQEPEVPLDSSPQTPCEAEVGSWSKPFEWPTEVLRQVSPDRITSSKYDGSDNVM